MTFLGTIVEREVGVGIGRAECAVRKLHPYLVRDAFLDIAEDIFHYV
jgi:hypothetical protein